MKKRFALYLSGLIFISSCQSTSQQQQQAEATPDIADARSSAVDEQIELGLKYASDGLYREAIGVFRKILKKDSKNLEAHRSLGIIYVKVGRYKRSIKHFETVMSQLKNDFDSNYYLAEAYRTQDRYADAIFRYKIALTTKPKNLLATKALAWSYYKVRYYRAAYSTIRRLSKNDLEDVQATIIQARVLNKMGATRKALRLAKAKLDMITPEQKPYLMSVIGDIYFARKDRQKAEDSYREALKEQPLLAGALLGLAKVLLLKGERSGIAVSYLERALRIKPGMVEALYYLGEAHKSLKPTEANKYFAKFVRQASGDPEFKRLIQLAIRDIKTSPTKRTALSGQAKTKTLQ